MIGGAQSHQELPFEHLVDALLPERNLAHNPLFQFKINQHVAASDAGRKRLGALEVEGFARDGGDARFDLAFDFSDKADGIEGYFTYANDLFEQATIERMAASLRQVLDALIRDPQQAIVDSPQLATLLPAATQAYPHGNFLALWRQAMAQGQAHGGVRAGDRFMTQAGLEAASTAWPTTCASTASVLAASSPCACRAPSSGSAPCSRCSRPAPPTCRWTPSNRRSACNN